MLISCDRKRNNESLLPPEHNMFFLSVTKKKKQPFYLGPYSLSKPQTLFFINCSYIELVVMVLEGDLVYTTKIFDYILNTFPYCQAK